MRGRRKFFSKRKLVCFNLEAEEKEKVKEVAKKLGMELSSFLRWVVKKEVREVEEKDKGE